MTDSSTSLRLEDSKIFVGGLHGNTTDESLKKYFEETCGEVEEANVMMDAHTNRSRGFGFVKFKNPASVNTACHQRIHVIDNKKVDPKPAYVKGSEAEVQDAIRQTKIFIGGLPQDATEDEVRSHFSKFGTVDNIDLKYDRETNRMRGFAFIGFESTDSAEQASKERYQTLKGKTIEIKLAEARGHKPGKAHGQNQARSHYMPGAHPGYGDYNRHQSDYNYGHHAYGGGGGYQQQQYYNGNYGVPGSYGQQGGAYGNYPPPMQQQDYRGPPPSYNQDYSYGRSYQMQHQVQQAPTAPGYSSSPIQHPNHHMQESFNHQRGSFNTSAGHGGYGSGYNYDGFNYDQSMGSVGAYSNHTGATAGSFSYTR